MSAALVFIGLSRDGYLSALGRKSIWREVTDGETREQGLWSVRSAGMSDFPAS